LLEEVDKEEDFVGLNDQNEGGRRMPNADNEIQAEQQMSGRKVARPGENDATT
jgi:hypothetical protein